MSIVNELRRKHGMTQMELAKRVGVSQPSIASMEAGRTHPRIKTAKKLAEVLGVSWDMFYADDDSQPDKPRMTT